MMTLRWSLETYAHVDGMEGGWNWLCRVKRGATFQRWRNVWFCYYSASLQTNAD